MTSSAQTPEPTDEQRAVARKLVLGWGMDDGFPALVDRVARALAAAVTAEREKVEAEYRSRIQRLIDDEKQALVSDPGWDITVWVPERAGADLHEQIFDALADLAYEMQPDERDWDIGCMSVKGHPQVTVKQLGWALDDAARRIREVSR